MLIGRKPACRLTPLATEMIIARRSQAMDDDTVHEGLVIIFYNLVIELQSPMHRSVAYTTLPPALS